MTATIKPTTLKKIIATIEDGDIAEAASQLELLKKQHPWGSTHGRNIHMAHQEVTIGTPDKAIPHLESILRPAIEAAKKEAL